MRETTVQSMSSNMAVLIVLWDNCRQSRKMKHLAAYLLLNLGGNSSPSADDIKAVLDSVGIESDDDRLEKLLSELKGKDIQEVCGPWEVRYVLAESCANQSINS